MPDAPPLPPVSDAHVPAALRLLTSSTESLRRDPEGSLAALHRDVAVQLAGATSGELGAALAVWQRLVDVLVTPEQGAALPSAPFRGPGAGPWHTSALTHLPARVLTAGAGPVSEALAGGVPDVPDIAQPVGWFTYETVQAIAAAWVERTARRRRAARTLEALLPTLDPRVRIASWWGPVPLDDEWRVDVAWSPLVAVGMDDDRQGELFGSVTSPLSYTARYPSALAGGSSRMAGSGTRKGHQVRMVRSLWLAALEGLLETWTDQLGHDVAGLPGSPEDRPTLALPTHRLTEQPLATVQLRLGSGLRAGGLRGGHDPLPGPGALLLPAGADAVSRAERVGDHVRVVVDLPARELPPMEDAVAGVLRVFAHRLLSDLPDLTAHAREVLTAWRDGGPGAWGTPSSTLASDVDDAVAFGRLQGLELET